MDRIWVGARGRSVWCGWQLGENCHRSNVNSTSWHSTTPGIMPAPAFSSSLMVEARAAAASESCDCRLLLRHIKLSRVWDWRRDRAIGKKEQYNTCLVAWQRRALKQRWEWKRNWRHFVSRKGVGQSRRSGTRFVRQDKKLQWGAIWWLTPNPWPL